MATDLTISRAADRAGVGVETIRFYERRGLIKQPMRPRGGGFRFYDEAVVGRIRFIRQAQDLGFSLREIKELLNLRADPGADCADVRIRAITKRDEVERKVAELGRIGAALDTLIASCPGGGALRACTILDAIEHVPVAKIKAKPVRTARAQEKTTSKPRGVSNAMKTAIFTIEGMHCDGCAETIKALLGMEPGVQAATVLFKGRNARVLYDPATTNENRLIAAIERGGYKAVRQPA